jgi:ATP-binding cassette, subfamily B, bacterial
MTSSRKTAEPTEAADETPSAAKANAAESDLPPTLSSMWRLCKLGYRHEPRLMVWAFFLSQLSVVPDALLALWLMLLGKGVLAGNRNLILIAALGLGVSCTGTWFLRTVSTRVQRRFRDKITIALESHVAKLQASVASIAHHERPEYLDRLSMLRNQVFVLDHMYMSLFTTCGWVLRLVVTMALLASIHPALLLLAIFAVPTVLSSALRPTVERVAQLRAAQPNRLARHLFMLATSASPGKEVRVLGIGDRLVRARRETWEQGYREISAVRWGSAAWHILAWAVFAAAYVGAVVFVTYGLHRPASSVLLLLAAGASLSMYISGAVGEIGFLRGFWADGSRRLAWLEDYAASFTAKADRQAPESLREGIRLEQVSFVYPGTQRKVLDDITVHLPAGAVVAIVGENGAGKTTLVKLLAKMYEPSSGSILVNDVPLSRIAADNWRARLAGAFQDFFRFEFRARHTVGLGDVPRLEQEPAVATAVGRAGAQDVVARLVSGLNTQLGASWPGGSDVSFGQWQKLALARGFMRDEPLLLILDEPTAALDAETEHALFERYAAAAHDNRSGAGNGNGNGNGSDSDSGNGSGNSGRITLLVSHRFSTVRMADLILVMDGARLVEVGTHSELISKGGQYADLYGIQAAAYR